jgi:hypothetical protein
LSDLSHFEPVWEDMRTTRAHLADMLDSMRSSRLIDDRPRKNPWMRTWLALNPELGCAHPNAVAVALVLTGEVVAHLCPDCDEQLPAGFESSTGLWPGGMI